MGGQVAGFTLLEELVDAGDLGGGAGSLAADDGVVFLQHGLLGDLVLGVELFFLGLFDGELLEVLLGESVDSHGWDSLLQRQTLDLGLHLIQNLDILLFQHDDN